MDYLSMSQAAKALPGKVAPSTVWRWAVHGIQVARLIIRLQCIHAGTRKFTTQEWLDEFNQRIADARAGRTLNVAQKPLLPIRKRRRGMDPAKVDAILRRAGLA